MLRFSLPTSWVMNKIEAKLYHYFLPKLPYLSSAAALPTTDFLIPGSVEKDDYQILSWANKYHTRKES